MFCFCHRRYLEKLAQGRAERADRMVQETGQPPVPRGGAETVRPWARGLSPPFQGSVMEFESTWAQVLPLLVSLGTVFICVPPFSP